MKKILIGLFILFMPVYLWSGGVLFMAGGVEDGGTSCPSLTGNVLTEDFSGTGLPSGWTDDPNVSAAAYDDTTNPPLTNYCFAGQQFKVNNSNDYWARTGDLTESVSYTEMDLYIEAHSLASGESSTVLILRASGGDEGFMSLTNDAGTLKILTDIGGTTRGTPVTVSTGDYLRIGLHIDSAGNTGAWIVYDYVTDANLGTWSGAAGNDPIDKVMFGPLSGAAAITVYIDNIEIDNTGWMQLTP